jgi:hypothetical protein
MLTATVKRVGTPASAPVQTWSAAGRACFRAWSRSGTARHLRHIWTLPAAYLVLVGV